MRHAPRGLSEEEAAAWAALAASVKPMHGKRAAPSAPQSRPGLSPARVATTPSPSRGRGAGGGGTASTNRSTPPPNPPPRGGGLHRPTASTGLDSHWDRKLKAGEIAPELTLDLHGHGLDAAYNRLMDGMAQARGMDARSVLVVTGKPRGGDPADRGERRGAIRAKILDWLAASEHGSAIAAVRTAHRRHGGEGALFIVLRRGR
ncbi:MAG: DNA mismatch repair protein MutS [Citromicrobium sp.]|nr:DNA mismatch repair protein MutS [Citromicrobium sp.]MBD76662.1 DNA mismatch repair protein MutS [Citromicrobium sp.]MBT48005.1 DNA mismatch repair protein MutS [Citromicrobium sp.]